MIEVVHRVKVFVFRFAGSDVRYLLIRARPRAEAVWGPLTGSILPSEDAARAVRRNVREEIGVERAEGLLDLRSVERTAVGDGEIVEWAYGLKVPGADEPALRLGPDVSECRWDDFPHAYQKIEFEENRRAMLRLHVSLKKG